MSLICYINGMKKHCLFMVTSSRSWSLIRASGGERCSVTRWTPDGSRGLKITLYLSVICPRLSLGVWRWMTAKTTFTPLLHCIKINLRHSLDFLCTHQVTDAQQTICMSVNMSDDISLNVMSGLLKISYNSCLNNHTDYIYWNMLLLSI